MRKLSGRGVVEPTPEPTLTDAASDAAVLRIYRQVFSVLAREAERMISSTDLLDVDEAILEAFSDSGSEGMTEEQVRNACRAFPEADVVRRFEVLKSYGAVTKVFERPNERHYKAAFAPYIMLMFLRRVATRGGQAELHQMLSMEHDNVSNPNASQQDAEGSVRRLVQVFRLIANELTIMSLSSVIDQLRENAQLLWGNEALITRAEQVHEVVLRRWPDLDYQCQTLRAALAAYKDAIDTAAGRLIDRAGTTRALGLLPAETWRTFARTADIDDLAGVLDTFLFDAPTPWFAPQTLAEAVASGNQQAAARMPPPRSAADLPSSPEVADPEVADQERIQASAENLLFGAAAVEVAELLRAAPDWAVARRILADMTAAHHDPDLPYELVWAEGLDIAPDQSPAWVAPGEFRRIGEDT